MRETYVADAVQYSLSFGSLEKLSEYQHSLEEGSSQYIRPLGHGGSRMLEIACIIYSHTSRNVAIKSQ